jgi:hypothetical protein
MSDITERLQRCGEAGAADAEVLQDAIAEIRELRKKSDEMEEILIILSRTEIPWDDEGKLRESFPHFRERYVNAIHAAAHLLGLDIRSTITRTEPKT